MENTENKYQRGKIYKIISNQTNLVYYGSTIEKILTNRLSGHRTSYKKWLIGKDDYVTSFEIIRYEDCKIILVESFPCNTKYELTAREQYYIDSNKCVNKLRAPTGLSKKEYDDKYRKENRDIISEKRKIDMYACICGSELRSNDRARHERSKKHLRFVASDTEETYVCECGSEVYKNYKNHHENGKQHESFLQGSVGKFLCECGTICNVYAKPKHFRTQKHQQWMNSQIHQE